MFKLTNCKLLLRSYTFLACLIMLCSKSNGQPLIADTLRITLPQAEQIFLQKNLEVLAAHYNVDAQKALVQQARLYDNPVVNVDMMLAANGKILQYGKNADGSYNGQYYLQVQQLIKTAHKRQRSIDLATTNATISGLQLQDLLLNLRFQLRTSYFTLSQQLQTLKLYESQLPQLNLLLKGMQAQFDAGNIAQKDLLRVQALVISLQQNIADLNKQIADTQKDLKLLLQQESATFIQPLLQDELNLVIPEKVDVIIETAKKSNPRYLLQQQQTVFQHQNLSYQKALKAPDITLGPNFDRNSNFAPNYFGIGVSIPVPVFNKNQGNIRSAEFAVKQQETLSQAAEHELSANVEAAYHKLQISQQQNSSMQKDFFAKYKLMFNNMLQTYEQRKISLLEFLDFFNAFTDVQQKMLQQQLNIQLAKEELNYYAGTDVVK